MPAKSAKQKRFMDAAAHSPEFAKKAGIPVSVAKEFSEASKGKKFGTGGDVNYTYGGKGQINKQRTRGGSIFGVEKNVPNVNLNKYIGKKEGGMATDKLKKLFTGKETMKEELAEAKAIKSGKISPMEYAKGEKMEGHKKGGRIASKGEHSVQKKSKRGAEMVKMAGGGFVKSADGCAVKGKTKGTHVAMKKGGKC